MKTSDIMELMGKDEALHPDLEPWVTTMSYGPSRLQPYLNSPLVQEMFFNPAKCALINLRYTQKKRMLEQYIKDGNVAGYIYAHERPYRFIALQWCIAHMPMTDKLYWFSVASVWIDSENIWQHHKDWVKMWNSQRGEKQSLMDDNELAAYNKLGDIVTVYRGINGQRQRRKGALSWTLRRDKAEWFSARHNREKKIVVLEGRVMKQNIHAILFGRNEQEVVCQKVVLVK